MGCGFPGKNWLEKRNSIGNKGSNAEVTRSNDGVWLTVDFL